MFTKETSMNSPPVKAPVSKGLEFIDGFPLTRRPNGGGGGSWYLLHARDRVKYKWSKYLQLADLNTTTLF